MNRHLSVIGAVLRKDVQSLWPLLLLVILLQVLFTLDASLDLPFISGIPKLFLPQIVQLASIFLVLAVVQLDASASLRHDWLTRPIPRLDLVLAKAVFILVATVLPISLASLSTHLISGHSVGESLLIATTLERTMMVMLALTLIAIAFLTATLVEAIVAIVVLFVMLLIIPIIAIRVSGVGEEIIALGTAWVILNLDGLFILTGICVAGWLQYARRNTTLARAVFALAIFLTASSPALFTWDRIFAVQKAVAADQSAADALQVELTPNCFPATLIDPVPANMEESADNGMFDADRRRAAGHNAITFSTAVVPSGAPKDWKVLISRVNATYRTESNELLRSLRPARFTPQWQPSADGLRAANHFWLLSRDAYQGLASQPAHLQLDYSLSLLRPHAIEISIDDTRKYFPVLGYCGALSDRSTLAVKVECFKHGVQPALVTAELVGAPGTQQIEDFPDFTPPWLEFFGGKHYWFTLRQPSGSLASRVKITAYEARAHVDRRLIAPGILGGEASACPAPAAK